MKAFVKYLLKQTVFLGILGFSGAAFSITTQIVKPTVIANVMTSESVMPAKIEKLWSVSGTIAQTSNLYDYHDGTRQDSADLLGLFSYKINKTYSLVSAVSYSQDLKTPESSDFGDLPVTLAHSPWIISKTFSLSQSATLLLPASKDSSKRVGMQFGIGTGISLSVNDGILIPGLSIKSGLSLSRLFDKYETALDGRVNTEYSAKQTISSTYSYKKFSASIEFVHKNALSYQGSLKEGFEHTEELGYSMNDQISFALGHTLAGSALKANGSDSNVSLINDNDSKVYGAITASY